MAFIPAPRTTGDNPAAPTSPRSSDNVHHSATREPLGAHAWHCGVNPVWGLARAVSLSGAAAAVLIAGVLDEVTGVVAFGGATLALISSASQAVGARIAMAGFTTFSLAPDGTLVVRRPYRASRQSVDLCGAVRVEVFAASGSESLFTVRSGRAGKPVHLGHGAVIPEPVREYLTKLSAVSAGEQPTAAVDKTYAAVLR